MIAAASGGRKALRASICCSICCGSNIRAPIEISAAIAGNSASRRRIPTAAAISALLLSEWNPGPREGGSLPSLPRHLRRPAQDRRLSVGVIG